MTYLASKAIEFGEKRKMRAITPFKVIQGYRVRYKCRVPAACFLRSDVCGLVRDSCQSLCLKCRCRRSAFLRNPGGLRCGWSPRVVAACHSSTAAVAAACSLISPHHGYHSHKSRRADVMSRRLAVCRGAVGKIFPYSIHSKFGCRLSKTCSYLR